MVYIIQAGDYFKVGVAKNVKNRINSAKAFCPFPIHIVMTIDNGEDYATESDIHSMFWNLRIKGEWFVINQSHIDDVKVKYSKYVTFYKGIENLSDTLLITRERLEQLEYFANKGSGIDHMALNNLIKPLIDEYHNAMKNQFISNIKELNGALCSMMDMQLNYLDDKYTPERAKEEAFNIVHRLMVKINS